MKVALSTLKALLNDNVVEIKFKRRRVKQGAPATRRMLCTNSDIILNSPEGRNVLGFIPTATPKPFNPDSKNLIVSWDILKRGYRMISMDNCELISQLSQDDFWPYYADKLSKMTAGEVEAFYNV